eukprot:CAMPEP_0172299640 /NCGR_PEP_ID=MMETSP1058-20130122/1903_1 /TAXON_ID=83371 /ORGANISM="Detonula confervacea, Strain CCMP 353" /LENGTH=330 /DNA_ID=CAMNT_0013009157 /DNA_START=29 /DNA_END=1021 /DNA_ORIENTATION=-
MTSLRSTRPRKRAAAAAAAALLSSSSWMPCHGFTATNRAVASRNSLSPLNIYAPPGSGYFRHDVVEDDEDATVAALPASENELTNSEVLQIAPPAFPKTYEPMLEYPGTMRPGRTPENMPYHDLPGLGINDPDPVPWPHFQEIEWHHKWPPPHEAALAMEEFIEVQGRWASVEEEAEMRMGMRRGVRERRESEETVTGKGVGGSGGSGEPMVIMDDEEEDEEDVSEGVEKAAGVGLGDGVAELLKAAAAEAANASDDDEDDEDGDDDDFLLDLGLGDDDDDEDEEAEEEEETEADDEDDGDISIDDYTKTEDGGGGDEDDFDDGGFDYGE